jgi:beta-phosphoglucomutase-like phosphatase (HAD superfamily)
MSEEAAVTISRRDFDATIFDLDGVLTDTTRLHAAAWKSVFDALLQQLEHVPPQLNQGDSRGAEDGRGYRH